MVNLSSGRKKMGFLVVNLTLAFLAAWLMWGGAQEVQNDGTKVGISQSAIEVTGKGNGEFSMRKASPALEEVIAKSMVFSSEFDARAEPIVSAPSKAPKFDVQAVSGAKPNYNWEALRLAGVVTIEGEGRFAVIEDKRTGDQALIAEGEKLKDGVVLVKIETNRILLESAGERKSLEILLEDPPGTRPRRFPRSVARRNGS